MVSYQQQLFSDGYTMKGYTMKGRNDDDNNVRRWLYHKTNKVINNADLARAVCHSVRSPIFIFQVLKWCATGVGSLTALVLYINDTGGSLISSFISYHQFVDNTQLYTLSIKSLSSSNLTELSSCAEAVTSSHIRNNLLLNANKTEAIVVGK